MTRLNLEPDVIGLAQELGLGGDPVEAIVAFCHEKIDKWVERAGGVATVADLEMVVTTQLQLVFEEVFSDEDLDQMIARYVTQGELVFAALRHDLDDLTFGTLIKRKAPGPLVGERYVAVIDCRGEKLSRRFFTRWHEIAHLLVLTGELEAPVKRATDEPLEQLMDLIAGRVGFYEPLFGPILDRCHSGSLLSFETVDAVRTAYCDYASFQSTLFACQRRVPTPVVYVEAEMKFKAGEARNMQSRQQRLFEVDPPVAKLRVGLCVPNDAAVRRELRVTQNMRVPERSVIHELHVDPMRDSATGGENLESWEFSSGGTLPNCNVWIEARKAGSRVIAIVQPDE